MSTQIERHRQLLSPAKESLADAVTLIDVPGILPGEILRGDLIQIGQLHVFLPTDDAAVGPAKRKKQRTVGQLHRHCRKLDLLCFIKYALIAHQAHLRIAPGVAQQPHQLWDPGRIGIGQGKIRSGVLLKKLLTGIWKQDLAFRDVVPVHIGQFAEDQRIDLLKAPVREGNVLSQRNIIHDVQHLDSLLYHYQYSIPMGTS